MMMRLKIWLISFVLLFTSSLGTSQTKTQLSGELLVDTFRSHLSFQEAVKLVDNKIEKLHIAGVDSLVNELRNGVVWAAHRASEFRLGDSLADYYIPKMKADRDTVNWIRILINQGWCYNRLGEYEGEIASQLEARRLAMLINDAKLVCRSTRGLSWLNFYIGNSERAMKLAMETRSCTDAGYITYGQWCNLAASIYHQMKDYNKAYEIFTDGINDAIKTENLSAEALYRSNRASLLITMDSLDKATSDIEFAVRRDEFRKNWHQYSGNMTIYARCILLKGDINEARRLAELALDKAREIESFRDLRSAYRVIYEIDKESGNFESALSALDSLYYNYNDYHNWKGFDNILTKVYETKLKIQNQRLSLVESESELSVLKLENANRNRLSVIFGLIILTGLLLIYLFRRNKFQKSKEERLEREYKHNLLDMEMRALRSQMNPHFLFNSLNSIKNYIIQNEPREATNYLNKFSKLMRLILNHSKEQFVSLKDELEATTLYMDLEKIRFIDRFDYKIQIHDDVESDILVPPMIFQPFVENSIWHAFTDLNKKGLVKIVVTKKDDALRVVISDDGIGRKAAEYYKKNNKKAHESMGVHITKSRIEAQKQKNIIGKLETIDIYEEDVALGTKVVIELPIYTGVNTKINSLETV